MDTLRYTRLLFGIVIICTLSLGIATATPVATQTVSDHSQFNSGTTDEVDPSNHRITSAVSTSNTATITISVNDSSNGQDSTTTTLTIEQNQSSEVPADFPGTAAQYAAIDSDSDGITLGELRAAVESWSQNGTVSDGVSINLGELREIVTFWSSS